MKVNWLKIGKEIAHKKIISSTKITELKKMCKFLDKNMKVGNTSEKSVPHFKKESLDVLQIEMPCSITIT